MKINGVFQEVVCKHQQISERAYKNDFLKIELKYGQDFGYLKTFPDIYGCAQDSYSEQEYNDRTRTYDTVYKRNVYLLIEKLAGSLHKTDTLSQYSLKKSTLDKRFGDYL